jgi:hypothetical protein
MPKKYDAVRGQLEGKSGLLSRLSKLSETKPGFRLVLFQKESGSDYVAVIEYDKAEEMGDVGLRV